MTPIPGVHLSDEIKKLVAEELFESTNKPKLHLYVDMAAMFDYQLTALLKLCTVPEEYEYVKKRLSTYALYKGSDITKAFPALKFNKQMIDDCLKNPDNAKHFSEASFVTNVTNMIPMQLMVFDTINKQTPLWERRPINVYFVNEFFRLTDKAAVRINEGLRTIHPDLVCHFRHNKIGTEDASFLKEMDHFIVNDMKALTTDQSLTIYKMLFESKKFIGATFFASHQLEDDSPWMDDEAEKRLAQTEKFLNTFTFFMTFDRQLILSKEVKDG